MIIERKIELLTAFEKGETVEIYHKPDGKWYKINHDIWNFQDGLYRIKPKHTFKFKVNDNLVCKEDANKPSPTIYTVINIDDTGYILNGGEFEKSPEIIEESYISEREVLWYFEVYDYIAKKYTMHPDRATIAEMDEEFGDNLDTLDWIPIYNLGFKLKEN